LDIPGKLPNFAQPCPTKTKFAQPDKILFIRVQSLELSKNNRGLFFKVLKNLIIYSFFNANLFQKKVFPLKREST